MDIQAKKEELIRQAEEQMSGYPQYDFRTPGWFMVKITHFVRTKMGVAFEKGDVAIAHRGWDGDYPSIFADNLFVYSWRNRGEIMILPGFFKSLEPEPPPRMKW